MNINLLKLITSQQVTFLKDINKTVNINKHGEYKYFKIPLLDIRTIFSFIESLDGEKLYLIIPFISPACKLDEPYLILSKQFLISKYSNELVIHDFLNSQFEDAIINFGMSDIQHYYLIFKYKSIKFDFSNKMNFN